MSVEQFTVQSSSSLSIILIIAAVAVVAFIALYRRVGQGKTARGFAISVIPVVAIIAVGLLLSSSFGSASTITVGSGYVSVATPLLSGPGNIKVTSTEIASAYVAQIGSGDLSLNKVAGTNIGNTNIGTYTLGNGKTAYVVSTNSTDLIIQLNSGKYVILGTQNTEALAASFSQNVYPLESS